MLEYTSLDGIIIQIGENAKENTLLTVSSNPNHWWMHTSGCPGCHVVICDESDELPKETKKDAMILTLHHSKSSDNKVVVSKIESITPTRQMGKVVVSNGNVHFMKKDLCRLKRVLKTRRKGTV